MTYMKRKVSFNEQLCDLKKNHFNLMSMVGRENDEITEENKKIESLFDTMMGLQKSGKLTKNLIERNIDIIKQKQDKIKKLFEETLENKSLPASSKIGDDFWEEDSEITNTDKQMLDNLIISHPLYLELKKDCDVEKFENVFMRLEYEDKAEVLSNRLTEMCDVIGKSNFVVENLRANMESTSGLNARLLSDVSRLSTENTELRAMVEKLNLQLKESEENHKKTNELASDFQKKYHASQAFVGMMVSQQNRHPAHNFYYQ